MRSYITQTRQTPYERMLSSILAVSVLGLLVSGLLDRPQPPLQWLFPCISLYLTWLGWEMYRGVQRFWLLDRSLEHSYEPWLGLGYALLAGIAIMLRLSGGLISPFYPIFYLAVAFLASVGTTSQGPAWFGYALLLEFASVLATGIHLHGSVGKGALHVLYLGIFAGSHHIFLAGLLRAATRHRNNKRQHELTPHTAPPAESVQGMTASSLEAMGNDHLALLALLKEGLDAHGCALLWLSQDNQTYEVIEIDTDAQSLTHGPFSIRTGTPASVFKGSTNVRLSRGGEHGLHLPYYDRHVQARALLAVPIRQGQNVRGAICIDRVRMAPFSAREEALLEAAAMVFGRALESERSHQRSDQELASLHQLHDIGQQLNQLHNETELAEKSLEAAASIAPFQWGFLSRYDQVSETHTVLATHGTCHGLEGQTFQLGNCLLSLSLKHGCPLPENGLIRGPGPYIAQVDPELPALASLMIFPLVLKREPVGCLVLGSEDAQCFVDIDRQKQLGALSHQLAALIDNSRYTEQIEDLVQHDNLTGLLNHRSFMERFRESFQAAQQQQRTLSLLLFDIDHFKHVNDRYGHPVGDRVLQQLAGLLRDTTGDIERTARYGGEEFALLLEDTSTMAALQLADKIRKQVAQLMFHSDGHDPDSFHVTISIGLATFPAHASDPETLVRRADEALFSAKSRGRNRAVLFQALDQRAPSIQPVSLESLDATPQKGWGWGSLPPSQDPEELVDPERWSWWTQSSQPPRAEQFMEADIASAPAESEHHNPLSPPPASEDPLHDHDPFPEV